MKKVITVIIASFLIFSLVSCAPPESNDVEEPIEDVVEEVIEIPTVDRIEAFATALRDAGIEFIEHEAIYTMVGAIDGRKFRMGEGYVGDGVVEVYLFDTSSEAYKTAESSGELHYVGLSLSIPGVIVNDGLVLVMSDIENESEIIAIFNSI